MFIIYFLPIVLFIFIYVGAGIYFSLLGHQYAFYQISPCIAIIPAIFLAWIMRRGKDTAVSFINGMRHEDIINMIVIFLLAGAFSSVTTSIGSVQATANFILSFIPAKFLLIGIFFTAAGISTVIGTSMGTIATICPLVVQLASQGAFSMSLAMSTVVGGAIFGDNLSLISDTTIAAVSSQQADPKKKFYLNLKIGLISALLTIIILYFSYEATSTKMVYDYDLLLIIPYLSLFFFSLSGMHVFKSLFFSLCITYLLGNFVNGYSLLSFNNDVVKGFAGMHEIIVLSLAVGGLSGLMEKSISDFAKKIEFFLEKTKNPKKIVLAIIAGIVSIFDILFANNTIAIIFSGKIAYHINQKYNISSYKIAAVLDIFSCIFQGIIPYGAQILLASSIGNISPISIMPKVYYCYVLLIISVIYVLKINKE